MHVNCRKRCCMEDRLVTSQVCGETDSTQCHCPLTNGFRCCLPWLRYSSRSPLAMSRCPCNAFLKVTVRVHAKLSDSLLRASWDQQYYIWNNSIISVFVLTTNSPCCPMYHMSSLRMLLTRGSFKCAVRVTSNVQHSCQ